MNREILFRGKRVDNGEWVEGFYQPTKNKNGCFIGEHETNVTLIPKLHAVYSETVGQFTELCDKNGVKIFDGDIVHAVHKSGYIGLKDIDFGNGVVEYHGDYYSGARWEMNIIGEDGSRVFSASIECEVIGNCYDNPELMKGE